MEGWFHIWGYHSRHKALYLRSVCQHFLMQPQLVTALTQPGRRFRLSSCRCNHLHLQPHGLCQGRLRRYHHLPMRLQEGRWSSATKVDRYQQLREEKPWGAIRPLLWRGCHWGQTTSFTYALMPTAAIWIRSLCRYRRSSYLHLPAATVPSWRKKTWTRVLTHTFWIRLGRIHSSGVQGSLLDSTKALSRLALAATQRRGGKLAGWQSAPLWLAYIQRTSRQQMLLESTRRRLWN
mmetsp:Transcript_2793/g.5291  ORF Transcript_2793/g.5291 Transcript_2793/m.5291 type:complete len:235 (+) Transcript_2793:58-762(+)